MLDLAELFPITLAEYHPRGCTKLSVWASKPNAVQVTVRIPAPDLRKTTAAIGTTATIIDRPPKHSIYKHIKPAGEVNPV
jgi:hypothetical protein